MDLENLVSLAQQGDEAAYAAIIRQFGGLIGKEAGKSWLAAMREDAVAEGLAAAAAAVKTYRCEKGVPFAGYMKACVRYRIWNMFRRERQRWQHEQLYSLQDETQPDAMLAVPDTAAAVETVVVEADYRDRLQRAVADALAELPAKQRFAVVATIINGRTLAEAAGDKGVTVQSIWNARKRGLTRLKTILAGMYISERG